MIISSLDFETPALNCAFNPHIRKKIGKVLKIAIYNLNKTYPEKYAALKESRVSNVRIKKCCYSVLNIWKTTYPTYYWR